MALEDAFLLQEIRSNLERTTDLLEVGKAISGEIELDSLLHLIMEKTSHLLHADRSTVFLVDQGTRRAVVEGGPGPSGPGDSGSPCTWEFQGRLLPRERRSTSPMPTRMLASIPKWTKRPDTAPRAF